MTRTAKGGKRADLGFYCRSAWEANTARYLAWLQKHGKVAAWAYEPDIFRFEGVKRNPISYTPDFKVTYPDGRWEYWEVKGWFNSESRSKLARMAKFFPTVPIKVIDKQEYEAISRWRSLIPNWETGE